MRSLRPLLALPALGGLLLCGCRLDPAVPQPEVDLRATWRERAAETASLANVAWFDVYRDDTLRGLVRTALENNPDLAAALDRIEEARAIAKATGADVYPKLDLAAAGGTTKSSRSAVSSGSRFSDDVRVSFDLTWEIDLFGRVRSQAAAAQARYFASIEAHRDVGMRLVSEVARAYFELRSFDEIAAISERTLKSRSEYVSLAKTRFEGGKTSEIDLRQAESEYWRTESIHVDALRQVTNKENQLSVLLGRSPGAVPRGRPAAAQPLPAAVPAGLPSDLLVRRPDIGVAEQLMVSETALVGAARANLYPRISLTGSFGWESDQLSSLFKDSNQTSSLIGSLLQPIFNAGQNRALVDAQASRMRTAMEAYRKVVLAAFGEVEDALVDYRRYGEQRRVQEKQVEALRRVLDLAETRWFGGVSQYLEVLDAQRELFDAEIELETTIENHLVALARLYKALGGGWEMQGPVCSPPLGARPPPCAPPYPRAGGAAAVPPPPPAAGPAPGPRYAPPPPSPAPPPPATAAPAPARRGGPAPVPAYPVR